MKKILNYSLILFIFLSSCQTTSRVYFQSLKPAEITIPSSINNLLVVNSSKTTPKVKFTNTYQKSIFAFDTLTANYLTNEVAIHIASSPRFDSVNIYPTLIQKEPQSILKPMNWETLETISQKTSSKGTLVLDALGIKDTIVNYTYYNGYSYESNRSLVFIINSLWRIYDLGNKKITYEKLYCDTLAFDQISTKSEFLDAVTDSSKRAYIANFIAEETGMAISDMIVPYWDDVHRNIFTSGGSDFTLAETYVKRDKWTNAAKIWKGYTTDKRKKVAAAACYNMAVAAEVQGKFDLALVWAQKSNKIFNNEQTQKYIEQLKKSIITKQLIDKQFGLEN